MRHETIIVCDMVGYTALIGLLALNLSIGYSEPVGSLLSAAVSMLVCVTGIRFRRPLLVHVSLGFTICFALLAIAGYGGRLL